MVRIFEAGVTNPQNTDDVRWTGETVTAASVEEAEENFSNRGFYRNLVVREI